MKKTVKRINVAFDEETYCHIQRLAASRNISMSELIRSYTEDGLNGQLNQDNIDFLSTIIRSQLRDVLTPQVERLASLSAKGYIEAATSALLNAETIARFVPSENQEAVKEVYDAARKKALASIHQKDKD